MSAARVALLALVCAACTGPSVIDDAGIADAALDATDDVGRPPRQPDAGRSYGACSAPRDCLGAGEVCDQQYPRGMCRPPCTDDASCPEGGACQVGYCMPRCVPGANDCRDDQYCLVDAPGLCFPSCSTRADATSQHCQSFYACAAFGCDPPRSGGAAIGAPCADGSECRTGLCWTPDTGWPGGMCTQVLRLPSDASYLGRGIMPSGGCEDAFVVLPAESGGFEGDEGQCVPRCHVDADCRDGYLCDHFGLFDAPRHDDGGCRPWTCTETSPCPAGRTCARFDPSVPPACFRMPP